MKDFAGDSLDYISELPTKDLIDIIENIWGFEETSAALLVLIDRDEEKAFELGIDILLNDKGDDYLQGIVWIFFFSDHPQATLAAVCQRQAEIGKMLLGDIANELSIILTYQKDFHIPPEFIRRMLQTYEAFSPEEREFISDYFNEFLNCIYKSNGT